MTRLLLLLLVCVPMFAADMRAGVARVKITPELPFWLTGYAARTHPANKVMQDLWAKALALDDGQGGRVVIVTTDLLGLPQEVSDVVAARVQEKYHLKRSQLLLNSSHTHSGPTVWPNLQVLFDMNAEDHERTKRYGEKLIGDLTQVVGEALGSLAPAELGYAQGEVGFAANRRFADSDKYPHPVDHSVPVLRVMSPDGKVRAVLFGYSCHNTTLTGDFYEVSGDYAGYAQAALEKANPGATALFMMLCGGDQNPKPRNRVELAEQHGNELAGAVQKTLKAAFQPVKGPIKAAYEITNLPFAPRTRAFFEEEAKSNDVFKARRAKLMLAAFDRNQPVRSVAYPVEAIRFNKDLTFLALGGEVVVDYGLRAKREYPNEHLVVAGYSNAVMSYIPTVRILHEGGYEAESSMIYYGQPGPYTDEVEEIVFKAIHRVMKAVGARPGNGDRSQ